MLHKPSLTKSNTAKNVTTIFIRVSNLFRIIENFNFPSPSKCLEMKSFCVSSFTCSLDNSNLSKANISKANLNETSLKSSNLENANLELVNLSGADISNSKFYKLVRIKY